jgi:hypothetical protein
MAVDSLITAICNITTSLFLSMKSSGKGSGRRPLEFVKTAATPAERNRSCGINRLAETVAFGELPRANWNHQKTLAVMRV